MVAQEAGVGAAHGVGLAQRHHRRAFAPDAEGEDLAGRRGSRHPGIPRGLLRPVCPDRGCWLAETRQTVSGSEWGRPTCSSKSIGALGVILQEVLQLKGDERYYSAKYSSETGDTLLTLLK